MEKGMTRVSVLYPSGEGLNFDMKYYQEKHLPLLHQVVTEGIEKVNLEKGGKDASFSVIVNIFFKDEESYLKNFANNENLPKVLGDVQNFTNAEPIVQVGEILI